MKSKLKTALLTSTSPSLSNGKWMLASMLLLVLLVAATQAADEKSVKKSIVAPSTSSSSATSANRDEIYIDDDAIDGSGGRGGIHDDLEKDPDYSGSGFGPDDEDAITDHHQGSHNTRVQNIGNTNTAHTPTHSTTNTTSTTNIPSTTTEQTSTSSSSTPVAISSNTTTTTISFPLFNQSSTTPTTTTQRTPALPEDDDLDLDDTLQGSGDDHGDDEDDDDDDDNDDHDGHDDADEEDEDDQLVKPHLEIETTKHETNFEMPKENKDNKNPEDVDDGHTIDVDGNEDEDEDDGLYTDVTHTAGGSGGNSNVHELDPNTNINSQPTDTKILDQRPGGSGEVVIMSEDDRTTSFFAQPGILAAVIGGAVVGLLCAILVVMFIVYRMRKKDEGSYALDEPKRSPANNSYAKNANNREFYA